MINWIRETLSDRLGVLSTKRSIVVAASIVLCSVTAGIGCAVAWRIRSTGDIGTNAVGALTLMAGITATLAGNAYRKPEVTNGKTLETNGDQAKEGQ